jgi:hypothetical protein
VYAGLVHGSRWAGRSTPARRCVRARKPVYENDEPPAGAEGSSRGTAIGCAGAIRGLYHPQSVNGLCSVTPVCATSVTLRLTRVSP